MVGGCAARPRRDECVAWRLGTNKYAPTHDLLAPRSMNTEGDNHWSLSGSIVEEIKYWKNVE